MAQYTTTVCGVQEMFWWGRVDSNHLALSRTDLQSAAPRRLRRTPKKEDQYRLLVCAARFELATPRFQTENSDRAELRTDIFGRGLEEVFMMGVSIHEKKGPKPLFHSLRETD